jgi:hypothetical protein
MMMNGEIMFDPGNCGYEYGNVGFPTCVVINKDFDENGNPRPSDIPKVEMPQIRTSADLDDWEDTVIPISSGYIVKDGANQNKAAHKNDPAPRSVVGITADGQVVMMLKKEVVKTQSGEHEKNGEYRQMLVQAIHTCAIKFPEVASTVVHLLMDFLGDTNVASAMDVVVFVREIIETNPKLRVSIITRLLDTFYQIRAARVCSRALWIIGEYCLSLSEVESGIATIKQCLGDLLHDS